CTVYYYGTSSWYFDVW
nr:immunoglobulin heavy chain junction region [Mus musculus]MBK4189609.1 immunoglobulin heavy chain junction region [Mus musculus]